VIVAFFDGQPSASSPHHAETIEGTEVTSFQKGGGTTTDAPNVKPSVRATTSVSSAVGNFLEKFIFHISA